MTSRSTLRRPDCVFCRIVARRGPRPSGPRPRPRDPEGAPGADLVHAGFRVHVGNASHGRGARGRSDHPRRLGPRHVEAIQIHHLVPGRYEVTHELVLHVRAGIDLGYGPELGVRAEDQIGTGCRPTCLHPSYDRALRTRPWPPSLRAHVEQVHEEIVGQRRPLGEDAAVLGLSATLETLGTFRGPPASPRVLCARTSTSRPDCRVAPERPARASGGRRAGAEPARQVSRQTATAVPGAMARSASRPRTASASVTIMSTDELLARLPS